MSLPAVFLTTAQNILSMGLYRLPAIVLRTYPFSDTHLIVTLMSPTHGKLRAIAKGARRIQSSLGRAVQPMVYAVFQLAEGKNLDCITQGVIKAAFPHIRTDLDRLIHGLYALELIDRLMEEPEPQANVFFLLLKTLKGLESGVNPLALLRVFEAHLFRCLGYAPQLGECVLCGHKESITKFSARLGGVLCGTCQGKDKLSIPLQAETLKGLKECFAAPPGEAPEFLPGTARAVGEIFKRYVEETWGKTMHAHRLVEQML